MKDKTLGERMKEYEMVPSPKLMKKTPVIIRIDGKTFHTLTKSLTIVKEDPTFCEKLHNCMVNTTKQLIANVQNTVFGYTQSDEISLLLKDWDMIRTGLWFEGKIQKICSVTASMATVYFARELAEVEESNPSAFFDCRVFNLPQHEVSNYFIWRQQDAIRNSVSMYGRSFYSHKQMMGLSKDSVIAKIKEEHGKNWEDLDGWKRNGSFVFKTDTGEPVVDCHYPIVLENRKLIEAQLQ